MVNVHELIEDIRGTSPPFECPLCQKTYKSYSGIEYHLLKYPHDGVDRRSITTTTTPTKPCSKRTKSKTKKGGRGRTKNKRIPSPPPQPSVVRETLTYAQAQKTVEFDFEGHLQRLDIGDSLSICDERPSEQSGVGDEANSSPTKSKSKSKSKNKMNASVKAIESIAGLLPKPQFRLDEELSESDAPTRSTTYFRFIERTSEELDEEVEYSADDEDTTWLRIINEQRKVDGLALVSQEVFETLMDRLEKESHFESQNTCDPNQYIDEDAVCCICNDGECANSNVILFCDMCNLAVHQECYGVPYIPEGQWLCRRCLNSPSRPVDCVLCPNKTGAFKQTDDNRWAHVVCALWIPEVCFANTVFLEPIDSIQNIPPARWKLRCYICRRTQGACIQCFKTNCYTAFHVTCAQQAGLYMKIEPIRTENGQPTVKKTAYCDGHSPGCNSQATNGTAQDSDEDVEEKVTPGKGSKGSSLQKPKSNKNLVEIRKRLSDKHPTVPIVNIPLVPAHRLSKIVSRVAIQKKSQFIQALRSYWMLKRQSRNGVPLLRRLQASHQNRASGPEDQQRRERIAAMKEQLHFWQRLRHDLERARLLVELIRKREKLKREHVKSHLNVVELKLKPLRTVLSRLLMQLQAKDPGEIFLEPVNTKEVCDYLDVIFEPMDFVTMREKVDGNVYRSFDEFEHDYNLIWRNCMAYNGEDTIYYRAATRLRDQGKPMVRNARRLVERTGVDPETGMLTPEVPSVKDREPTEEDFILTEEQRKDMTLEDQLKDLNEKLEMTQAIKHGGARAQRNRQLRKEIALLKRKIHQQERKSISDSSVGEPFIEDGQPVTKKAKMSPDLRLSPIEETPPVTSSTMDMSDTGPVSAGSSLVAEQQAAGTPSAQANPRPGTNRRSGILFNKNKFRARHNIQSSNEKDVGIAVILENGEDNMNHEVLPLPPGTAAKTGTNHTDQGFRRNSSANDSNEENNWDSVNRMGSNEDNKDWYNTAKRKTSRLNSYPDEVTPTAPAILANEWVSGDTTNNREPAIFRPNNFKENSRPKPRNSRSNTSGSEADGVADGRSEKLLPAGGLNSTYAKKRGRASSARSRCNSVEEDIVMMDASECNGTAVVDVFAARENDDEPYVFEYLDLVWAKCRGYPSYPALIINPKTKRGFVHKGVPIPVPPEDVLKERRATDEHLYLVLFFDARRTWQWLPSQKLELLGQNNDVDRTKMFEGKKPSLRKSVQQAFARALSYKRQTTMRDDDDTNKYEDDDDKGDEETGGDNDSS